MQKSFQTCTSYSYEYELLASVKIFDMPTPCGHWVSLSSTYLQEPQELQKELYKTWATSSLSAARSRSDKIPALHCEAAQ